MKSSTAKPTVLLIETHPEPSAEKLAPYIHWLEPHFDVTNIYVAALESTTVTQDSIVVTGSEWEILKNPVPEALLRLYRETAKPLLGICWGHQTLALAWGASIISGPIIQTIEKMRILEPDELLEGVGETFYGFESHYEHVVKNEALLKHFDILASSPSCQVEAIRHKSRPLWGTQFHPERSGELGFPFAVNFARIVMLTIDK